MATFVPAARTLSEMRTFVLNYLQLPTTDAELTAIVDRSLADAVDFINSRNWNRIGNIQTVTLTVSVRDYSLATDFRAPRYMELLDSSDKPKGRVYFRPEKIFHDIHGDEGLADGQIEVYTILHDTREIRFNRAPDANFIGQFPKTRHRYFKRIARMSTASDTIDAPPEFALLVGWYARDEVSAVRGNVEKQQIAFQRWNEIHRELSGDDSDDMTDWDE